MPLLREAGQVQGTRHPDVKRGFMHGWVGCPACGIYKQWTRDPAGAIRTWNRREGETLRLDGGVPHQSPAATASPRGSRGAAAGTGEGT